MKSLYTLIVFIFLTASTAVTSYTKKIEPNHAELPSPEQAGADPQGYMLGVLALSLEQSADFLGWAISELNKPNTERPLETKISVNGDVTWIYSSIIARKKDNDGSCERFLMLVSIRVDALNSTPDVLTLDALACTADRKNWMLHIIKLSPHAKEAPADTKPLRQYKGSMSI